MEQKLLNPSVIQVGQNKIFRPSLLDTIYTDLPPGVYESVYRSTMIGPEIQMAPLDLHLEGKVLAQDDKMKELVSKLQTIYSPEGREIYVNNGFSYFNAILFYGPPGTGKSVQCALIAEMLREAYGGYTMYLNPNIDPYQLQAITINLRKLFPDKLFVFVLDECEESLNEDLNLWKTFLDSPSSDVNNCVLLLSTNHFESIDSSLLRPSRIKFQVEIKSLSLEAIQLFINKWGKNLSDPSRERLWMNAKALAESEESLTIDQLKHMILDQLIATCRLKDIMA